MSLFFRHSPRSTSLAQASTAVEASIMQLYDPRLRFARPLIDHWSSIRRGLAVVPWEADLDPREIQRVLPSLSIMDVVDPEASVVAVMGREIRRRYPADPTHDNWYDHLPGEGAAVLKQAVRKLVETPCGIYYRYRLKGQDGAVESGEALVLPMMRATAEKPSVWISVASIAGRGGVMVPAAALEELAVAFVDIGAGTGS
jgi:hypothetical protein